MNDESVCRILIVDDDLDYAAETAAKLKEIRPALLNNNKLEIELTNNAYFVAEELRRCPADQPRWDVIISDVYMPIPLLRGSSVPDSTASFTEYHHAGTWPCYEFEYPGAKPAERIEHGGSCIAEVVTARLAAGEYLSDLKMILMSDCLSGEDREHILSYQKVRGSWLRYYDKADWRRAERLTDWPAHQSEPDMFQWALFFAIAERRTKDWGPLFVYKNIPDVQAVIGDKVTTDLQRVIDESWRIGQASKIQTVLITGEVGTGREVFARFIHHLRLKKLGTKAEFVGIDCSSISHDEFQRELFDYGEEAAGGTLFIDEVDKLTPPHQGKIYRLLKDKRIRSAERLQPVDFTAGLVICTAESNLDELYRSEMFHADLYFLLKDEQIHITPLRERPTDAVSIAEGLAREGETGVTLTDDARNWIETYHWPGNNKELRGVISAAVGKELSSILTADDLEAVVKTGRETRSFPEPETKYGTGPRKLRNFTAEPPFQLHWGDNLLIDRQKRPIPLADDLYRVLKELLRTERGQHSFIKGTLSFDEIAALYRDTYDEDHAAKTARRFVQNLRRFLAKYGVDSAGLIQTRKGYGYQIGSHWANPPVIYASEPSLVQMNDLEKAERDQLQKNSGRKKKNTPDH